MKKIETDPLNENIIKIKKLMVGLFLLTLGYFVFFLVFRSDDFINNTYNGRHEILAERVIRGDILGSKGEVIVTSQLEEDGSQTRLYPYNNIFCHVVGRYSKGRTGLEESENINLLRAGINSFESISNELKGEKNKGHSIVTSLDVDLQKVAHEALGDNKGAVVVLEPATGKILAMVSKPDYNPNKIDDIWDGLEEGSGSSPLLNRASQGKYPPGSTFKLITSLAYIRENPNFNSYNHNCEGKITIQGSEINCFNNKAHGSVGLKAAFAQSCNTAFSEIGTNLDLGELQLLCEKLYFNKDIKLRMPVNPSYYDLGEGNNEINNIMQTTIGQGHTLITPLHNAMIMAAVANDGVMMKPYVVDYRLNSRGRSFKHTKATSLGRVMTLEESQVLKVFLEEVVQDGTASALKDLGVRVGGKTGSAEQDGKPAHAWFVGMAPMENPEIVMAIIVEDKGSGGTHAVPIAGKLINAYFD